VATPGPTRLKKISIVRSGLDCNGSFCKKNCTLAAPEDGYSMSRAAMRAAL
jgi:hypothetical protein